MTFLPIHNQPVPATGSPCLIHLVGDCVRAGFPNAAEDLAAKRIDLTAELITHPQATFLVRVSGDSMTEAGIADGDVLIVDRALKPEHGNVVVAMIDGDFTVKYLHQRFGQFKLRAANPTYPDIVPREGQMVEVWGVVTASIKRFRK
jgi:DNA polymerase V